MAGAAGKSIFEFRKDRRKTVSVLEACNDCQEMRPVTLATLLLIFYGFYRHRANYQVQSIPANLIFK